MNISEIEPIEFADEKIGRSLNGTRGCIVTRDELMKIVELPCLDATIALYDKNIRTISTSANRRDIGFNGYISIDLLSLSEENKQVLKKFYPNEYAKAIENTTDGESSFAFEVPITSNSTVEEVSQSFMNMIQCLQIQDVLYGKQSIKDYALSLLPLYGEEGDTVDDMIRWIMEPSVMEFLKSEGALSGLEFFDKQTNSLWLTRELYDKHIKYKNFKKQYTEMFKGRFPNENENNVGTHYNEREDYMDIP